MYYFFNSTINAYNHMSRIDYTIPVNMIEILNYSSGTRYKYCGTCYADKYTYGEQQSPLSLFLKKRRGGVDLHPLFLKKTQFQKGGLYSHLKTTQMWTTFSTRKVTHL